MNPTRGFVGEVLPLQLQPFYRKAVRYTLQHLRYCSIQPDPNLEYDLQMEALLWVMEGKTCPKQFKREFVRKYLGFEEKRRLKHNYPKKRREKYYGARTVAPLTLMIPENISVKQETIVAILQQFSDEEILCLSPKIKSFPYRKLRKKQTSVKLPLQTYFRLRFLSQTVNTSPSRIVNFLLQEALS